MDKTLTVNLEVKKNDKSFIFSIPAGCPYGETYDACFEILNEIVKMSQEAAEKAKRVEEEGEEVVEQTQEVEV